MLTIIAIILLTLIAPPAGALGLIGLFVFHASFFVVWISTVLVGVGISVVGFLTMLILGVLNV